jgi:hypothetical protein
MFKNISYRRWPKTSVKTFTVFDGESALELALTFVLRVEYCICSTDKKQLHARLSADGTSLAQTPLEKGEINDWLNLAFEKLRQTFDLSSIGDFNRNCVSLLSDLDKEAEVFFGQTTTLTEDNKTNLAIQTPENIDTESIKYAHLHSHPAAKTLQTYSDNLIDSKQAKDVKLSQKQNTKPKATKSHRKKIVPGKSDQVPQDLISLAVVVKNFCVSHVTLKRNINDGKIKSYRPAKAKANSPHLVSAKEIAAIYPRR